MDIALLDAHAGVDNVVLLDGFIGHNNVSMFDYVTGVDATVVL